MRALLPAALTLLTGCATDSAFLGYCSVFEHVGGKADPVGLIRLPPQIESELRVQLPAQLKSAYVCWYTSGNNIIAGGRRNSNSFNYGYTFTKHGDSWKLSDEQPEILAVPHVIQ